MKTVFRAVAIGLMLLIGVLLFNTFRISSKQLNGVLPAPALALSDSVITHLSDAVKFRTVSYEDRSLMDSTQFEKFIGFLEQTYPLIHARLKRERINGYALLFEWKGKNTSLKPALLMGHYDVVPVVQGTERMWKHQPFAGDIAEGFVYGRGTLDDKVTVIGVLEAIEYLLKQNYRPERSFYLAFGHDEEVSGRHGARSIASLLESRKVQLEYVMDEGGTIKIDGVSGITTPIALVGIAEKGYTTLQLTAVGDGGHSSMPPPQTAIGMMAEAIDKLQKHPFPARLEGAASYLQDYLAPEMPFGTKLAMANRWLLKPIIIDLLSKTNAGNAMVRTSIAPTVIHAGVKDNVLPVEVIAKINFRILPGDSVKGVADYVKKTIDNDRITVETLRQFDSEPSFVSDTATLGFRALHRTVKSCFPDVIVAPYLVVGATDARFYRNVCANIYRFMPVRMNEEDLKRPHGTNERISVTDFKKVVNFYVELVKGS
ncbi:M20 family peptidase [Runella slithyformis]|uniref:Gly-Xaa carboxypeptidase n=1 Tax=Runella slithyformis (strain ATCC 29530 / DSM 19594 / LMG 11500 / NCIMB 11436 / LSU 4) TaxID=761193 RepID=A0A7U3ZKU5_RUNSL|nr:M20 family peptidase [Runella slithyformis]AEI49065.1 Gly-Xaa carboxypeptidase [Runella slithyformis DSM 19594]